MGKHKVVLSITITRQKFRVALPVQLRFSEFNAETYEVKIQGNKDESHSLTRIFAGYLVKAEKIFQRWIFMDRSLSIETFKREWRMADNRNDFIAWAEFARCCFPRLLYVSYVYNLFFNCHMVCPDYIH